MSDRDETSEETAGQNPGVEVVKISILPKAPMLRMGGFKCPYCSAVVAMGEAHGDCPLAWSLD